MRKLVGVLAGVVMAAGSLVAVGVSPAASTGLAPLKVDAVVNGGGGFPTADLQLHRECSPAGNAKNEDSTLFSDSQTDFMTATNRYPGTGPQTCTVSVVASGGMTFSIACVPENSDKLECSSNDAVTYVTSPSTTSDFATITVTFDRPAPDIQVGPSTVAPGAAAAINGTACPGGTVSGSVAFTPPLAFGPVPAAAGGTWSTSIVVPPGTPSEGYAVNATCTLPVLPAAEASAAEVSAQATFDSEVKFLSVVAAIPATAVPAAPSFTG